MKNRIFIFVVLAALLVLSVGANVLMLTSYSPKDINTMGISQIAVAKKIDSISITTPAAQAASVSDQDSIAEICKYMADLSFSKQVFAAKSRDVGYNITFTVNENGIKKEIILVFYENNKVTVGGKRYVASKNPRFFIQALADENKIEFAPI